MNLSNFGGTQSQISCHDIYRTSALKTISFALARTTPFIIGVFTDADENLGEVTAPPIALSANINEAAAGGPGVLGLNPLGTQGFSLGFSQLGC